MLELCSAIVVARTEAEGAGLGKIARRFGFGDVAAINSRGQIDATDAGRPVSFFLIHHHVLETPMHAVLSAVRSSTIDRVRFSPVILLMDDCPFETYLHFIHLGFDDVLTLPDKRPLLIQRLEAQLGQHVYFRTESYFGPDRRRFDVNTTHERRGSPGYWHEQISFRRDGVEGVTILERHSFLDGERTDA